MQLSLMMNAKRNIMFGILNKIVVILCPFIVRTVIQVTLGEDYLGLNSLFSSILSVLSLAELGFGTAIIYNMYKPVAENDIDKVCSLLNYYKKIYRTIGIIILAIGILLLPFLDYLISGEVPSNTSLYGLYLICLINTVISYFMFAYLSSLIVVYQREDINSKTNLLITLLLSISQISVLYVSKNYYLFTLLMPVFTIANNLRIAFIVHRMFPQYKCKGSLDQGTVKDIRIRVSGAFVSKVCQISRNSFDSICTSMYLGLAMTAIYNNYYYIMNAVTSMLSIVSSSLLGGVGNHVATKSVDDNYNELRMLDFVYMWISGWCTVCLLCLLQPFMRLWMGESLLLEFPCVVLFCIYFYVLKTGDMRSMYSTANGLWWFHRNRSVVEAAGNLFLNFVLGYLWGIYGIIIATLIMLVSCNFIWASSITFKQYFGRDRFVGYIRYHVEYFVYTVLTAVMTFCCCQIISVKNVWIDFFIKGLICILFPNVLYFIRYRKKVYFIESCNRLMNLLKRE